MDVFGNLLLGLTVAISPINLAYLFLGVLIGMVVGIIPGFGPAAALAVLSALFVAALEPLGGLLAMIAYLAAAHWLLNRRRTLQNVLLALLLPAAMYLVFRVWLNAAVPRGPLGF